MIEQDTIRLLRECDAGVEMGVASISEVLGRISDKNFRRVMEECRTQHEALKEKIRSLLEEYHDDGKEPAPMAKGMSWIKTNVRLAVNEADETIADLASDGCSMGVKSLSRYLNQYKAADEQAKSIAKKLIALEEKLEKDVRAYL